jgi:hypothetical protein
MSNFFLGYVFLLLLCWLTIKLILKYLPPRNGKFLDADGYALALGEGLLVDGIFNGHGISFVLGLMITLSAAGALLEKYRLRRTQDKYIERRQ